MPEEVKLQKRRNYIPVPRDYLKGRRNEMKYSMEGLSRELGISAIYYYQIEGGQRGLRLPVNIILDLIHLLQFDAIEFLTLESQYQQRFAEQNSIESRNKTRW